MVYGHCQFLVDANIWPVDLMAVMKGSPVEIDCEYRFFRIYNQRQWLVHSTQRWVTKHHWFCVYTILTCVCDCVCVCLCVWERVCVSVCVCERERVCVSVCVCVWECMCVSVYACVGKWVCVCVSSIKDVEHFLFINITN